MTKLMSASDAWLRQKGGCLTGARLSDNFCYSSSFKYTPTPEEVFEQQKQIVAAQAYILVKTSEEKAYPLIIQFHWAPSIKAWLPDFLAVAYVGSRKMDPVF